MSDSAITLNQTTFESEEAQIEADFKKLSLGKKKKYKDVARGFNSFEDTYDSFKDSLETLTTNMSSACEDIKKAVYDLRAQDESLGQAVTANGYR
ncbi:MAG: hypothetical protein SPL59_03035 [Catonella sp.]|nr:hypothetical protein [Catonella sp.]